MCVFMRPNCCDIGVTYERGKWESRHGMLPLLDGNQEDVWKGSQRISGVYQTAPLDKPILSIFLLPPWSLSDSYWVVNLIRKQLLFWCSGRWHAAHIGSYVCVCQAEHDKQQISFVSDAWNDEKIADSLGAFFFLLSPTSSFLSFAPQPSP